MFVYPKHEVRRTADLCGNWRFAFLGPGDPDDVRIDRTAYDDWMPVPMAFDAMPRYAGRRGLAAYKTTVRVPPRRRARVEFGAAGMWCRVFVDGRPVGEHTGGYTPFAVDIPPSRTESRELVVLADNQFNVERSPLQEEYFDWYHYGGITRPVSLHVLPATFIERLDVRTEDWRKGRIGVAVLLGGDPGSTETIEASVDGKRVLSRACAVGDRRIELGLSVPAPKPWSVAEPNLHYLRVQLGQDDLCVRFGLRQVRVRGDRILLNGKPLKLLGYCRHEAHPQFGPALPESQMAADLALLKDLGCNFVRGSHYPQDQRFLDLCDEVGMLVWEESLGWQQEARHFTDERYMQLQLEGAAEMVRASFNHPSVILWGVFNESRSDLPEGYEAHRRLLSHIRSLDPTRPVTFASCRGTRDVCQDLADVASFNFYPGWYSGSLDDVAPQIRKHLKCARKNGPKPFIVSEIGAGAVPGWRDQNAARWTEQYQAALLERAAAEVVRNRKITGVALWQFCDCRTSEQTQRALGRPRGFNNKGTVDEYRRPKMAYEVVKRIFRKAGVRG
ncbi:MAG: beta-galactosidase [Kiritimatiellae bacterium]|nr:beta-galactosidase [Kiritimatiellia bacterium]